uniref:Uncharacterized protein n=1 Tax=Rhizophora mucronata TaxID=61149 RepID=A0A2P2R2I2_RHIMU
MACMNEISAGWHACLRNVPYCTNCMAQMSVENRLPLTVMGRFGPSV